MAFIKTKWTPEEAEEWTKEDIIIWVLSPISYVLISVGSALSIFLIPIGFLLLALGVIVTIVLFAIANPKLNVISGEYEKRQKEYLERLERITRWEE
ncbi:MAG: hypothetical protein J7L62_07560 [Candidatus Aminicenantes bacterium]|nr:hypothetical protein [Candidatus Aminicenantes bacterium]